MPISDAEFTAWLSSDTAKPVVLVEATHSAGTEYISDRGFRNEASYSPNPGQVYEDRLKGNITIDSKFGGGTVGGIQAVNVGELDSWLYLLWRGFPFVVLLGDATWNREDFRIQVNAINAGITLPSNSTFQWGLFDRSELLVRDIGSETLPILLGKCFNVEPVLTDFATLEYTLSDGPLTAVTEVRDNGAVLTLTTEYTVNLTTGKIFLVNSPVGRITCDAEDSSTFTPANMITDVCTRIGVGVDAANLATFGNTATIGYYMSRETAVKSIVDDILTTVGGEYRFELSSGDLQIFRLELPSETPDALIFADDTEQRSLKLSQVIDPINVMKYAYNRNWSPQSSDSTADGLDAETKKKYEDEYLFVTKDNTLTDYPIASDKRVDSLFFFETDAQTECNRKALIRSVERRVWEQKNFLSSAEVEIGDSVNVTYPKFDFINGVDCRIVGTKQILGRRRVGLSLWQ